MPYRRASLATTTVNRLWAWTVLLIMGLAWGLSFSFGKIAATGGAHPLSISLWQCWTASVLLIGIACGQRRRVSLTAKLSGFYIVIALLGLVIPTALFYYAASRVSAGVLSISVAIVPILTFLGSAAYGLEKVAIGRMTGVALGLLAIVLLIAPTESLPDRSQLPWVLLALISAVCYATLNMVLTLKTPPGANRFMVTCGMFVAASLIMVPIVFLTGSFTPLNWPWGPVEWAMIGLGVISATAYTLYFHLIDRAGPVFTSQVANLVTLCGVLWGMIIFGEQHSAWIWLSLATMMVALAMVAPRAKGSIPVTD
jgi:drug/metabolite transporter (DMT)-like permease